jgi:hypothetical protein
LLPSDHAFRKAREQDARPDPWRLPTGPMPRSNPRPAGSDPTPGAFVTRFLATMKALSRARRTAVRLCPGVDPCLEMASAFHSRSFHLRPMLGPRLTWRLKSKHNGLCRVASPFLRGLAGLQADSSSHVFIRLFGTGSPPPAALHLALSGAFGCQASHALPGLRLSLAESISFLSQSLR